MAEIDLNAAEQEATFRRALEAFNTADWSTFRDSIADGCVYEELATAERFDGAEAYLERVKGWKSAFPDMVGTVDQLRVAGDAVVAEVNWRGTHTGTLRTSMGEVPATGKPVDTRAALIVQSDASGRAAQVRHYQAPLLMMTQLGLMPGVEQAAR